MAVQLEPIPASAPKSSLLTTSRVIRTTWDDGALHEGWPQGQWPDAITWIPDCPVGTADPASTWPTCPDDEDCITGDSVSYDDKAGAPVPPSPYFVPFFVYGGSKCASTFGRMTATAHKERAERLLTANLPVNIARTLESGQVAGVPQCYTIQGRVFAMPSLQTSAEAVTSGAVDINEAMSLLIGSMESCGQYNPVFHMPRKMLPIVATEHGLIELRGDTWYFGEYPIVFGPGYSGAGPVTLPAQPGDDPFEITNQGAVTPSADPADDETWIYASGPVERAVSESTRYFGLNHRGGQAPIDGANDDAGAAFQNFVEVIAEKLAVFRFDPCCVRAALVSLSDVV